MSRELLFSLAKKDFSVRWFSGTGKGGQHRNKHQNCCEITHIETGVSAIAQGRSRTSNQRQAFRTLARRLHGYISERAKNIGGESAGNSQDVRTPETVVRTYHAERNEVRDHKSEYRQPFRVVLNNPSNMIDNRRLAMVNVD